MDSYETGIKSTLFEDSLRLNAAITTRSTRTSRYSRAYSMRTKTLDPADQCRRRHQPGRGTGIRVDSHGPTQFTLNAAWLDTNYDKYVNQDGSDYTDNELPYSPEWKVYVGTQSTSSR